jgi:hypothetical protein
LEDAGKAFEGWRGGKDRHAFALQLAKAPQIIKAENVVHMGMRVEHSIHTANLFPQALCAEIRRRVHDE